MATPESKRLYGFSDAQLIQRSDALLNTLNRDLNELSARGVDALRVDTLQQARNTFDLLSTDVEEQSGVSIAATAKTTFRTQLEKTIRSIRGMAETQFGRSGHYKTFGFDDLTRLTDNDLVRCGRRVHRVATALMPLLASEGLTPTLLIRLADDTDMLDQTIDAVGAAEETRDIRTQERVQAGNALFEQLSKLAKIGQSFYADTHAAKYNDYFIDDQPTPPADSPAA
ncbi:MAG: hypothetical protein EOP52_08100 [Sphingobacteriales bacterium]|nr:MAG: hypothetical protein EOP52_08100 [Sphingobacteriales bacterium]